MDVLRFCMVILARELERGDPMGAPVVWRKRLEKFIAPHLADHPHTLRSTQHFLEIFKPLMAQTSLHLFTADVNSLFPSIPLPLVSSLLHDVFSLITPSTSQVAWLTSLTDLLLHNNYFSFDSNLFLQTSGAPMGSPLSSSLAEITMQNLETAILPHFSEFFVLHWYRYVDDIFILTNASPDTVQAILDKMTEHTPQITFSLTPEQNNQIAFLDVLITREETQFHTQVYHKPTANTSIIPATSMPIRAHKLAAFRSFFSRALTISSKPQYLNQEVRHIFDIGKQHGFPLERISHIWHQTKNKPNTQLSPAHSHFPFLGSLTYIPGVSERLSHWLHRRGYRVATTPCCNIHQTVRSHKPPEPPHQLQNGVYSIPILLPDGSTTAYIGSTIRRLDQRLQEHIRSCRDRNVYSALGLSYISGGKPDWPAASIIGHAKHTSLLRWKEALLIHTSHTINQPSLQINPTISQATGLRPFSCHALPPADCPGRLTYTAIIPHGILLLRTRSTEDPCLWKTSKKRLELNVSQSRNTL